MAVFLCLLGYFLLRHGLFACPSDVLEYEEVTANLSCTGNLYGHCLIDETQRVVLACLTRAWIQPGFCPLYNSDAKKIDVFLCKETLGKCPDTMFWSNELYRFQSCLIEFSSFRTSTLKPLQTNVSSNQDEQITERTETPPEVYKIAGIAAAVAAVVTMIIAYLIIRCRGKGERGETRSRDKNTEPKECDADGLDTTLPLTSLGEKEIHVNEKENEGIMTSSTKHVEYLIRKQINRLQEEDTIAERSFVS